MGFTPWREVQNAREQAISTVHQIGKAMGAGWSMRASWAWTSPPLPITSCASCPNAAPNVCEMSSSAVRSPSPGDCAARAAAAVPSRCTPTTRRTHAAEALGAAVLGSQYGMQDVTERPVEDVGRRGHQKHSSGWWPFSGEFSKAKHSRCRAAGAQLGRGGGARARARVPRRGNQIQSRTGAQPPTGWPTILRLPDSPERPV